MADTTNLNNLILKYRRRVNDMTKKDGTFYSLTDLTTTNPGSLYSGMGEDVGVVPEANAGAQTNQEIADLATDSTNMFLDALAKTFEDSRKNHFPTYAEMTKYVPEYVSSVENGSIILQSINAQLSRYEIKGEIQLPSDTYYGYPVSATLESNHFKYDKEIVVQFSEPKYKSLTVDFKYDELLEDPIFYLSSTVLNNVVITVVKLEWYPIALDLQDWPPNPPIPQQYVATFKFFFIRRQPPAIVDSQDILLNPKYHDKILDIMVQKHEMIRELTRQ